MPMSIHLSNKIIILISWQSKSAIQISIKSQDFKVILKENLYDMKKEKASR